MKLAITTLLFIMFFQIKGQIQISNNCDTLSQQEMNICIYNKYQELDSVLIITKIKVIQSINEESHLKSFNAGHKAWLKYREESANLYQGLYRNGSAEIYFKYLEKSRITISRIEELEKLLKHELN